MYKTMQVAEYKEAVAESVSRADKRSVCIIRTAVGHNLGLSAIAELLMISCYDTINKLLL